MTAACTSGVCSAFMPLAKTLRTDFVWAMSAIGNKMRLGWAVRMSARIWIAVT